MGKEPKLENRNSKIVTSFEFSFEFRLKETSWNPLIDAISSRPWRELPRSLPWRAERRCRPNAGPVFLSTWARGKPANERAAEVFKSGGSLLDAVEKGINVPESDPNVTSVGYGGIPNAEGVVELDAAIMDGTRHRAGSVCSLHMIKNPISVARLVMEKTRHTTLAG